jgi:hypothetical protein
MMLSSRLRVRANSSLCVSQILQCLRQLYSNEVGAGRAHRMSSAMYCCWTAVTCAIVGLSLCAQWIGRPTARAGVSAASAERAGGAARTDGDDPPAVRQQPQIICSA